jgi:hypothetical protein
MDAMAATAPADSELLESTVRQGRTRARLRQGGPQWAASLAFQALAAGPVARGRAETPGVSLSLGGVASGRAAPEDLSCKNLF